jgi:DNA polymerase-3 subunit beta
MFHSMVKKSVLLNAVKTVSQIIPQKTSLFCLNNIKLIGSGILNKLVLQSSDLDNFCEVTIPVDGISDNGNEIFVDAKTLLRSITNIKSSDIEVIIDDKLNFKCDDLEININATINKDEYPSFPAFVSGTTVLKMKYSKLLTALKKVGFAADSDFNRPKLTNVCIRFDDNKAIFGATNGHKLTEFKTEYLEPATVPEVLIRANKAINFLVLNPGDMVEISIYKTDGSQLSWIKIKSGGATLVSKYQFDSTRKEYPDYQKVIPSDHNKFAIFNREALIDAVKNLNMVSNRKTKLIVMTLDSDLKNCDITANNQEKEVKAFMSIPVEYTGEEFRIGFNSMILLQILQRMKSEFIMMSMKEQISATIFTPVVSKNEVMLLMPLRIME